MNLYMCVFMCPTCLPGACRGGWRTFNHLELELCLVVVYHVGGWEMNPNSLQEPPIYCWSSMFHDPIRK